jgi:hypothetical protein
MSFTARGSRGVIKGNGVLVLAWISFFVALIGGSALAASFLGGWISAAFGFIPYVAPLSLLVGVAAAIIDAANDGVPNRLAIWMAIVLPSVARGVNGELGARVRQMAAGITDAVSGWSSQWLGASNSFVMAFGAIAVALLMARRVVRKGGG